MNTGAFLPLRFYPALSWTDYERTLNYSGDKTIPKEHNLYFPAFQFTSDDVGRHMGLPDLYPLGVYIVNYDTGDEELVSLWSQLAPNMYSKSGDFRSLVYTRFPNAHAAPAKIPEGRYYYRITELNDIGSVEYGPWYSDVFELCDLELDVTALFNNETGLSAFSSTKSVDAEYVFADFCKIANPEASAYFEVEVFMGEELDLYVHTFDYLGGACASTIWNTSVFLELRDGGGFDTVVSETHEVDTIDTSYVFKITSGITGTARLYFYIKENDLTKGGIFVYLQRRYTANNIQLRYKNSTNFCKTWYEDDYENVFFFDTKQVIDENSLEETVVEDDETNKYRIIGTNKKWNSLQMVGGETLLNAMSLLRLHDDITIYKETGEPITVIEMIIEQSVIDYNASKIKLVYREDSCSVEACGYAPCCPTLNNPIMEGVYYGIPAIPPAAAANDGDFVIIENVADGQFYIYESNGAAWALNTDYDVQDDCVEARQHLNDDHAPQIQDNRFFWYQAGPPGSDYWRQFIELDAVNDNADGTADLVTDARYRDGVTCRGEYYDTTTEEWIPCTDPVDLVAGGGAITLICSSGVGTFDFRLHIYTDDCDYGYSVVLSQTIT